MPWKGTRGGGGSGLGIIKSIQQGYVNLPSNTNNITINEVNKDSSLVYLLGQTDDSSAASYATIVRADITSNTNLQLSIWSAGDNIAYRVVEYDESTVKSVQEGTASPTSNNHIVNINAVDLTKCILVASAYTDASSTTGIYFRFHYHFNSPTQIEFFGRLAYNFNIKWKIIEFK